MTDGHWAKRGTWTDGCEAFRCSSFIKTSKIRCYFYAITELRENYGISGRIFTHGCHIHIGHWIIITIFTHGCLIHIGHWIIITMSRGSVMSLSPSQSPDRTHHYCGQCPNICSRSHHWHRFQCLTSHVSLWISIPRQVTSSLAAQFQSMIAAIAHA